MGNVLRRMRLCVSRRLRNLVLMLFVAGVVPPVFAALGDIDSAFGMGGWRALEAGDYSSAQALALDPSGSSYIAAHSCVGSNCSFTVLKLDSNGSPAKGFGEGGKRTIDMSGTGYDYANALALDVFGNVYVAGGAGVYVDGSTDVPGRLFQSQFVVVKIDSGGNPVPSFGAGGKVIIPAIGAANAIALDAQGNIYVAGTVGDDPVVFKLDARGSPVTDFGVAGKATIKASISGVGSSAIVSALALDAAGNCYLAGTVLRPTVRWESAEDFALFKLDANGNGVPAFGAGGTKIIYLGSPNPYDGTARALVLDNMGNVFAAGNTGLTGKFVVVKLDADGNPAAGFGVDGKKFVDLTNGGQYSGVAAYGLALDRRGNILVAGKSENEAALVELDPAGDLVPTFGVGGIKFLHEAEGISSAAYAIALDAGGRVILAGRGGVTVGNSVKSHVAVVRLQADPVVPVQQTGWWWNPSESGRGFFLETNARGTIFFASYLYASNGRATWYASALQSSAGAFVGSLDAYAGGQTLSGAYQAPTAAAGAGGSLSLSFSDDSHGMLAWAGGTTPIQRFLFADDSHPPAFQPQRGWWWNPAESGRGFALEVQGSTMFLSGYMYDADGNPLWYLSSGSLDNQSYQGNWTQYGNGQTLGGPYQPASLINGAVGAVSIAFSSPTSGVMTLPDGRNINIVRLVF